MRYEEPKLLIEYLENIDIITLSGTQGGDGSYEWGGGLLPQ